MESSGQEDAVISLMFALYLAKVAPQAGVAEVRAMVMSRDADPSGSCMVNSPVYLLLAGTVSLSPFTLTSAP